MTAPKLTSTERSVLRREAHELAAAWLRERLAGEDLGDREPLRSYLGDIAAMLAKRSRLDALMSSEKQTWRTPESFLELVRAVAPIGLDPFGPGVKGARVDFDLARGENALRLDWITVVRIGELIFCNPEYGRKLDDFMSAICAVGQAARGHGIGVLALIPARTDAAWLRDFGLPPASDAIAFMHGRLKFDGAPSSAPFPSAVPFWGPPAMVSRFGEVFAPHAEVWRPASAAAHAERHQERR